MNSVMILLLLVIFVSVAPAAGKTFPLPAVRSALLEDERVFAPFARQVAAEAERLLATEVAPGVRKMLLAIRVHHSLHVGDERRALESAAGLCALLPEGAEKDYAGLTTRAWVEARRATGGEPSQTGFRDVFTCNLEAALAALPRTAEMRAVLANQRQKAEDLAPGRLRAEFADLMAGLADRSACTLAEGDQLLRLRHRYADLLPLRGPLLAALARAMDERPTK